jgi:hypothetical protein
VPRVPQEKDERTICIFWAYTWIFLAIALGATPIGSTVVHPMIMDNIEENIKALSTTFRRQ